MTEQEKSRVIFEALWPERCWHEDEKWHCKKCGENLYELHKETGEIDPNPNYFRKDLPDNVRVELVTAAENVFGRAELAVKLILATTNVYGLVIPAATVAEAIYQLIQKETNETDYKK